jgi:hypothetical protein
MEWKMPFYNLLNMMLTGVIFTVCYCLLFIDDVVKLYNQISFNNSVLNNTIIGFCAFAIFYQIGLIINRLGSIIIEPVLFKIIKVKPDHAMFTLLSEKFSIMKILSREYALSRTQSALFLLVSLIAFFFTSWEIALLPFLLSLLFLFSAIKHSLKINNLHKLQYRKNETK